MAQRFRTGFYREDLVKFLRQAGQNEGRVVVGVLCQLGLHLCELSHTCKYAAPRTPQKTQQRTGELYFHFFQMVKAMEGK